LPKNRGLALLPILFWTLSGCLWPEQIERTSYMKKFDKGNFSPNHALIEVALIERPLADDYINNKIWERADELLADSDRRRALDSNGLRVGQLIGTMPGEFQQLLLSKQFCSNPRAMIFPAGQSRPIYLGAILPQSTFEYVAGNTRSEVAIDQARYVLDVSAAFDTQGRTKLTFTPKVETGEQVLPFVADPLNSGWRIRVERASKKYEDLSWDVTLAPNQFCIVGARLDRERTLGQTAFTEIRSDAGIQRLLVVRNCRSVTAAEANQVNPDELVQSDKAMPLALQAAQPVSRGRGEK
jgi:hypothetical protein